MTALVDCGPDAPRWGFQMLIHRFAALSGGRKAMLLGTVLVSLAAAAPAGALAATFKTLHKFSYAGSNGRGPESPLVKGAGGALYGTTMVGGKFDKGVVFELKKAANGKWNFTILHSFKGSSDGQQPTGSLNVANGIYYGTTDYGGAGDMGTAYQIQKQSGAWKYKVLYSFSKSNGVVDNPSSGVLPLDGSLFGVSYWGGSTANGDVYRLKPKSGGGYTAQALEPAVPDDLQLHVGDLVAASDSLMYGVTEDSNLGVATVFQVAKSGSSWVVTRIFAFDSSHTRPRGPLLVDKNGRLYGVLSTGGANNGGAVFRLHKPAAGDWTVTYLHEFKGGKNGSWPDGKLVADADGNLLGVTQNGGKSGSGTIFRLTKPATFAGTWKHTVLYSFKGGNQGSLPVAGLTKGPKGVYYGVTASGGGTADAGTIFEFKP